MNTYDPTDLDAQRREQDRRRTRANAEQELEDNDLRWLMNFKEGRRIVWRLLERAGVNRSSFNANALLMAFAEGNRNLGTLLLTQITSLCPKQYVQMLNEHRKPKEKNGDGDGRNQN